jgi:hypothetical protein
VPAPVPVVIPIVIALPVPDIFDMAVILKSTGKASLTTYLTPQKDNVRNGRFIKEPKSDKGLRPFTELKDNMFGVWENDLSEKVMTYEGLEFDQEGALKETPVEE